MHFHNIGIDNQEGVEEDFQRDLSTEFGEGSEAEAANISLVEQGKHHFFKSFNNRYCYATPLLFILIRKGCLYESLKFIMLRPVRGNACVGLRQHMGVGRRSPDLSIKDRVVVGPD